MGFEMNTSGFDAWEAELRQERQQWSGGPRWVVGTAVEYAIYLEFGRGRVTADDGEALRFEDEDGDVIYRQSVGPMDPKPFFRPAVAAYQANLAAAIDSDTETTFEEIDSIDELVRTIALGLERRIKRIITAKGLVDTGTLRASVMALPTTAGDLPRADEVDPAATADIEVGA